jgi:hypothetical protein
MIKSCMCFKQINITTIHTHTHARLYSEIFKFKVEWISKGISFFLFRSLLIVKLSEKQREKNFLSFCHPYLNKLNFHLGATGEELLKRERSLIISLALKFFLSFFLSSSVRRKALIRSKYSSNINFSCAKLNIIIANCHSTHRCAPLKPLCEGFHASETQ